ncbi:MAG: amidohydrolase family protein [Alphaproteobacteria bacterium]|nr:amidohydrolase family protein [Alphaproteobacteria bacterium]
MALDLLIRNARLAWRETEPLHDIGVRDGRIVALQPGIAGDAGEVVDAAGRLVSPGFVESHIHLDKSCIIDRCGCEEGRNAFAVKRISAIKPEITADDAHSRAARTLERCLMNGATIMRTHAEVDPRIGLRGFEGVKRLVAEYAWAIDIEICVMAQEGWTNLPGVDELMVAALQNGARVVGGAPGYDTDHPGQIRRIFELAREYDLDVDIHLDFGNDANDMDVPLVCDLTEQYGWGGRVAIGHVTKMCALPPDAFDHMARRLADTGVALTILPATDLFLMGRNQEMNPPRGIVDGNRLIRHGATANLSTNNVMNPFTPYGDCNLIRMANLYGLCVQAASAEEIARCFDMFTIQAAKLMRVPDYGIAVGNPADLVIVNAPDRRHAIAENRETLMSFKRGRRVFTREPAVLHRPS